MALTPASSRTATPTPGTAVTSIAKAGSTALTGAVTLTGGTNVTLTQAGQDVSIAAAGGASAVLVDTTALTHAQVLALPTTPVTLLAAQGANTVIVAIHAVMRLAWVADYTNIDAACLIAIKTGDQFSLASVNEAVSSSVSGVLAGGGPDGSWASVPQRARLVGVTPGTNVYANAGAYDSDISNTALTISATNGAVGDFTGGDAGNVLTVTVLYYVVTF